MRTSMQQLGKTGDQESKLRTPEHKCQGDGALDAHSQPFCDGLAKHGSGGEQAEMVDYWMELMLTFFSTRNWIISTTSTGKLSSSSTAERQKQPTARS